MASPQKENGFTSIANEIISSLVRACLLGSEYQVVFWIIRQTYGFQKKEDFISLSQFEKWTGLSRPTVVKTLKNLLYRKIIIKEKNKYIFNKDWEKWGSKGVLTSKGVFTKGSKGVLTGTSKGVLTHKRKKENKETSTSKEDAIITNKRKIMKQYEEPTIDIDTGETNKPKEPTRQKAINYIKDYFGGECDKKVGIKPMMTFKQNIIIANLFKKGLKPSQITDVIDWWFQTQTDKGKIVQISICLSSYNLNNYQVMTGKKI